MGLQGNREEQFLGPGGRGVVIAVGFLPEAVDSVEKHNIANFWSAFSSVGSSY